MKTLTMRMLDAGELYISWTWDWQDGRRAHSGVHVVDPDALDAALTELGAAVPSLGDGLANAMTRGAFVARDTEFALAERLSRLLLPPIVMHGLASGPALVRIQPSPRTAQVPWELLPVAGETRLVEVADVVLLAPAGVTGSAARTVRRWSESAELPVIAVLDPKVPGHAANSALGSVLGPVDPASELGRRIADLAARMVPDGPPFRRPDLDRAWLSEALRAGASRLLYVGHVSAASPESGEGELAQLHLACTATQPGHAQTVRGHRPLSAKDLLLGTHRLPDRPAARTGAQLWPMPPRVALIACESGGDLRFVEPLGLVAAMLHNGAELVTASRWALPTDLAFHRLAGAPQASRPLQQAICAIDAAHDHADPIGTFGAWQRACLAAWRSDGRIEDSPLLWAAFANYQ